MRHILVASCFLFIFIFSGCVSSEETGGGKSVSGPIKTPTLPPNIPQRSVDTTQPPATTAQPQKVTPPIKQAKRGFTSKQDTVIASVHKKSIQRSSRKRVSASERKVYSVQVGAFSNPTNALRCQKIAKERFPNYDIHNRFNPKNRFYRVSIGSFETHQEAIELQLSIKKQFPKEYSLAHVMYLQ
jgi:cell division septation protein DedD